MHVTPQILAPAAAHPLRLQYDPQTDNGSRRSPDYWRPSLKEAPLAALMELGYQPLRYKGMAYETRRVRQGSSHPHCTSTSQLGAPSQNR